MAGMFFYDGQWLDESPKLTGPMDHAFWMSSVVFDGAPSELSARVVQEIYGAEEALNEGVTSTQLPQPPLEPVSVAYH